ncbi:hypothetical protein C922_05007 [Plasmodium inui San Antonio 1]|uniref:Uncharacterized protein n=1 Tax=Plasmodium inui San Antonio 1 TaxID=1237626 RepID=W6ZV05_9APIC|nr:hypothetical protein C922_05007 [Plasmodium inui San Antonio 1]EUD64592.1 hypothetical protein C922_05007 [Plasmodium inui San Antonio 1]
MKFLLDKIKRALSRRGNVHDGQMKKASVRIKRESAAVARRINRIHGSRSPPHRVADHTASTSTNRSESNDPPDGRSNHINVSIQNIQRSETRRYYLTRANRFVNDDGLKGTILSAVHCSEQKVLLYLFVFSLSNVGPHIIETIGIYVTNPATEETVVKKTELILANGNSTADYTSVRAFSNIKVAIKIEENKQASDYASENSCIQELLVDNMLYAFEYRLWRDYEGCTQHASKAALSVPPAQ